MEGPTTWAPRDADDRSRDPIRRYRRALLFVARLHELAEPPRILDHYDQLLVDLAGRPDGALLLEAPLEGKGLIYVGSGRPPSTRTTALRSWMLDAMKGPDAVHVGAEGVLSVPLVHRERALGAAAFRVAAADPRSEMLIVLTRHLAAALGNALRLEDLGLVHHTADAAHDAQLSIKEARVTFERRLIEKRLTATEGNIAQAARSLKMDRGQLSRMIKAHGLDLAAFRGDAADES